MKIVIEFVEPEKQRYSTCGDYWIDGNGDWQIRVSEMEDARSMLGVAMHELYEMGQVVQDNVPMEEIDKFDIAYEEKRMPGDDSEPGDDPKSPYFEQHQMATVVEKIYVQQSGMPWRQHEEIGSGTVRSKSLLR